MKSKTFELSDASRIQKKISQADVDATPTDQVLPVIDENVTPPVNAIPATSNVPYDRSKELRTELDVQVSSVDVGTVGDAPPLATPIDKTADPKPPIDNTTILANDEVAPTDIPTTKN